MAKAVPMVTKESVYIKVYGHGELFRSSIRECPQTQPPDGEFKPDMGLEGGRDNQWQPPPTEHKEIHNHQNERTGV